MRRTGVILGGVAALGLCAAGLVWATWPQSPPEPDWSAEYAELPPTSPAAEDLSAYDLTPRPPEAIAAGTVVERTAPAGWSHLVIKSLPRVRADQQAGLPEITVKNASWMFTAFVADVRREQPGGPARFRAVALGLGAKANGRDTILTPETARKYGAGWIGREILGKGYEVQRKAVVVARGPTFGLVDTPVWYRCGDGNRLIRFRYALLVDAASGRLDTLVWRLDDDCGSTEVVWLKPDTIDPAELVVDRKKVNLIGMPSDDAFAIETMPPARAVLPLPPDLRPLAARTRFTAAEVHALEAGLRKLTAGP